MPNAIDSTSKGLSFRRDSMEAMRTLDKRNFSEEVKSLLGMSLSKRRSGGIIERVSKGYLFKGTCSNEKELNSI